jgi:hypothetical protein
MLHTNDDDPIGSHADRVVPDRRIPWLMLLLMLDTNLPFLFDFPPRELTNALE